VLPPGAEIVYDRHARTHAFRFRAATVDQSQIPDRFSFLAAKLFASGYGEDCRYFPEEFSLLFTFKMSDKRRLKNADVAQCLFAVTPRGWLKLRTLPIILMSVTILSAGANIQ